MPVIPSSTDPQPGPSTRINQWAHEVAENTQAPPATATQSYRSKLRSSIKPAHLTEASSNPRLPKRKAFAMSDSPEKPPDSPSKRSRGRPKTKGAPNTEGAGSISDQSAPRAPSSVPNLPPSKTSRASKSRSPKKRNTLPTFDQTKSETAIDMIYLRSCTPSVKRMSFQDLRKKQAKIPPAVEYLYKKLNSLPPGVIPQQLKVRYLPGMWGGIANSLLGCVRARRINTSQVQRSPDRLGIPFD